MPWLAGQGREGVNTRQVGRAEAKEACLYTGTGSLHTRQSSVASISADSVCVCVCERDRVKSVLLAFPSLLWLLVSSRPDEWVSDGQIKVLAALCELWRDDTCGFDYLLPCLLTNDNGHSRRLNGCVCHHGSSHVGLERLLAVSC